MKNITIIARHPLGLILGLIGLVSDPSVLGWRMRGLLRLLKGGWNSTKWPETGKPLGSSGLLNTLIYRPPFS
jgi:hypothetical protein